MKKGPKYLRIGGDMHAALEKLTAKLTGSDEWIIPAEAHPSFRGYVYKRALDSLFRWRCIEWGFGGRVRVTPEGWWQACFIKERLRPQRRSR